MKNIAIVGYSGHFGRLITSRLLLDFPDCHFFLLGRKKPAFNASNIEHHHFDFEKDVGLPCGDINISLLIDLSGPVRKNDRKLFRMAAQYNIPYMDMAIHNSHLSNISHDYERYPSMIAMVHFGFFPGISNLIIKKGFEISGEKSGILINEFPAYAGGGKNVSISLSDLLKESKGQVNIDLMNSDPFRMHSIKRKFPWNNGDKYFYQWEYPEIPSFKRSDQNIILLHRYISIKPGILNPAFNLLTYLWNSTFHSILKVFILHVIHFLKSTIFSKMDPSVGMRYFDKTGKNILIELKVKSAVTFHGFAMSSFLKSYFHLKIKPGLYTPEQIFSIEEILEPGEHELYSLKYYKKRRSA